VFVIVGVVDALTVMPPPLVTTGVDVIVAVTVSLTLLIPRDTDTAPLTAKPSEADAATDTATDVLTIVGLSVADTRTPVAALTVDPTTWASTVVDVVLVADVPAPASDTEPASTPAATEIEAATGVAVIDEDSVAVTSTAPPEDVSVEESTPARTVLLIVLLATATPSARETAKLPTDTLRLATTAVETIVEVSVAETVSDPGADTPCAGAEVFDASAVVDALTLFRVMAPPRATAPATPCDPATATATPTAVAVIEVVDEAVTAIVPVLAVTFEESIWALVVSVTLLVETATLRAAANVKPDPADAATARPTAVATIVAVSVAETVTLVPLTVLAELM
jgi:hypothetical protein